jgi:hypothetical protein
MEENDEQVLIGIAPCLDLCNEKCFGFNPMA